MKITTRSLSRGYQELIFEDRNIKVESGVLDDKEILEYCIELLSAASDMLYWSNREDHATAINNILEKL